jgi:hypothetical protein
MTSSRSEPVPATVIDLGGDRSPDYVDGFKAGWERALAAAEAAPLDVERLARAIALTIDGVEGPIHPSHRKEAEDIAREYAALRSPDTEPTEPGS